MNNLFSSFPSSFLHFLLLLLLFPLTLLLLLSIFFPFSYFSRRRRPRLLHNSRGHLLRAHGPPRAGPRGGHRQCGAGLRVRGGRRGVL